MYNTFFELEAPVPASPGKVRRVHCVIKLQHRATTDIRLCWLQAMVLAREVLERMPGEKELRPIPAATAKALLEAAHLPGIRGDRVFALTDDPNRPDARRGGRGSPTGSYLRSGHSHPLRRQ